MDTKHTVKFEPSGRTVHVPETTSTLHAATDAGITLNAPCGGHGSCGKCRVHWVTNPPMPTEPEQRLLNVTELEQGIRLACQGHIESSATINIPEKSLLSHVNQILLDHPLSSPIATDVSVPLLDPPLRKVSFSLSAPSREDAVSDLERLGRVLGPFTPCAYALQRMPGILRDGDWRGTALLRGNHLVDIRASQRPFPCLAAAFDIGTTTLAGTLIDLDTGKLLASAARMNAQTQYGDDVLSRILFASQHPDGLARLGGIIREDLNDMIGEMVSAAGVESEAIYETVLAGNSTMLHLFAGIDPSALGQVPFTPAYRDALHLTALESGLHIHPCGQTYLFPVIGGFVGGDTVAGILVTQLAEAQEPTLFVDIGTNGEIVAAHEGRLVAASTAAGPAFEGARIEDGMRATEGAIEHVAFDGAVNMSVIGGGAPAGLCGSALIDLTAELRRAGLLDSTGALVSPPTAPAYLRERLVEGPAGPAFIVAPSSRTKHGRAICLTQRDIREFQLAAGAIRAGISLLLQHIGIAETAVARFLIAGGFGNYIRRENAQCIGLIPREIPIERVEYIGNSSLAGARLACVSNRARQEADTLAERTTHIDLSLDPEFQLAFAMAMYFPE